MTYITGGAVQLSGTTSLIDLPGISAPTLSASGHGRIYFDSALNTFKISQNGSAYVQLDTGITQLTGDATAGPGSGSQALTLTTVNSNVGSFSNANITVDGKGRITAASSGTAGAGTITFGNGALICTGNQSTGNNANYYTMLNNNLLLVWGGFIVQSTLNSGTANMSLPSNFFNVRHIQTTQGNIFGNSGGIPLGYWYSSAASTNIFSGSGRTGAIFCDGADNNYLFFGLTGGSGASGFQKINGNSGQWTVNNWVGYQYIVPLA